MNAPIRPSQISSPWPRVRLGDIAEHRLGKMLDKAKNTGVPRRYLRNPNVRWFDLDLSDLQEILVEEKDVHKYELRYGDVVICEGGEAGRAALWTNGAEDIIFQKAIHRVRVGPKLDARFLIHRLMFDYFNGGLNDYYTGATIKHFTGQDLARYEIPLPPLREQRRIVAILDKADGLRRKRTRAQKLLNGFAQSIFIDMFGSLQQNSKRFPVRTLSEITECLDYARKPVKESERTFGPVPYYGANGRQGWIDQALFNEPLVLVAEDGGHFAEPTRGVAYKIDGPAWVNNHAHILRANTEQISASYLHAALRNYDFAAFISGTTRSKLTQGQLNRATIMVPPLELQSRFEQQSVQVEGLATLAAASLNAMEEVFLSLQSRAFSGQL